MASASPLSVPVVGTTTRARLADLHTFARNARRGDIDAIAGSLRANDQFKPVVANIGTHTGRPNEVLAGNHTLMAFRQLAEQNPFDKRWSQILVHWVDVDDDMATRIVLVDNRSFEQGEIDTEVLVDLLGEVGVEGTGYSDDDFATLEATLNAAAADSGDGAEPEPAAPSLPGDRGEPAISYTILFDDETQQDSWFEFVRWLADRYPDDETIAERLVAHLNDTAGERD